MRRISLVGVTMFVASITAVLISFAATAEGRSGQVSQGSVVDPDSRAALAAQRDLDEEEKLPDYTQVVDNTTKGRFVAPGWEQRSGSQWSHGESYVSASGGQAARFRVKIPTTNDYSVYAWWPQAAGNTNRARFGVGTAGGTKWDEVDQRVEGGMWIKIGSFPMTKGERVVQVAATSAGGGQVVADAVAVVRGEAGMPPAGDSQNASAGRFTTTSSKATAQYGRQILQQARKHKGDRYSYGTCTKSAKSCTCLTKMSVAYLGHKMDLTENGQWRYRRSSAIPKSRLRAGDEVFFKESGPRGPITHVGIYAGNGMIVHASSYFGRVVEKEMKYITGYFGAKRFMQKG